MQETFYGYIASTKDALLIFEATRQGLLPIVPERLTTSEKQEIRPGSIFIFCEQQSKIKRWTDARLWSPSRISGNFLVYQEVENKIPKPRNASYSKKDRRVIELDGTQEVTGSKGTYRVKKDGLMKKTIAVQLNGSTYHLVSYFTPEERESLPTPSAHASLAALGIGSDLLLGQGFRRPLDINGTDTSTGDPEALDYEWSDPFGTFDTEHHRLSSIGSSTLFGGSNCTTIGDEEGPGVQDTNEGLHGDHLYSTPSSFFIPPEEPMPILDTFDPSCMELVAPAFSEPEIPCSTRLMINDSLLLSQLDDLLELSDPDHSSLPSIPRMTRFPEDYIRETAVAPQEKGRLTLMEDSSMSLESLIHFN